MVEVVAPDVAKTDSVVCERFGDRLTVQCRVTAYPGGVAVEEIRQFGAGPPVDERRLGKEHQLPARLDELADEAESPGVEVLGHGRDHDLRIGAFSDDEFTAPDRAAILDDVLRAQVVFRLRLFERGDETLECAADLHAAGVVHDIGVVEPDRRGRFQDEDVVHLFALAEHE